MPTLKLIRQKRVAITTGDVDGIGFEVSAKALCAVGPQKNTTFFLFRPFSIHSKQLKYFKLIDSRFGRFTFHDIGAALAFYDLLKKTHSLDAGFVFDIALKSPPAEWVIAATYLCKNKLFDSLVTGPISKIGIQRAGYKFVGHTGIFRHVYPQHKLFMAFVGKDFHVLLATDHQTVASVEKTLSDKKYLASVFRAAREFSAFFKSKNQIALLGLNPHAGEKGILGSFEKKYFSQNFPGFSKPLSPDAAFLKNNLKKYKFFLALYHDQGLIPFKMHHGQDSGVHITVGLPFVRTSVDHGTANDIFNKNKANPASMIDAIKLNIRLINGEKI